MGWPTTTNPKTIHVNTRFPPDEATDLEQARTAKNMSKSAFVREAVRRMIAHDKRKAAAAKEGHE